MRPLPLLSLALLSHAGCRCEPLPPPPPAPRTASVTSATPIPPKARFELVDLLDFGRHQVRTFAFSSATQELLVSFSDRLTSERESGNELFQYDLSAGKAVSTYRTEPGWMFDSVEVLPGTRRAVAGVYKHGEHDMGAHWAKLVLVDTERRRVLAADLGVYDDRSPVVELGKSGKRFRVANHPLSGPGQVRIVCDLAGAPAEAPADEFPPPKAPGPLSVIESSKMTLDTAGLYYIDAEGRQHLVARNHWHDNYALTRDGEHVVTTTWDGEVLAWSTREKAVVFREKIASQYGYLAYDDKHDRFLLGDAVFNGTTKLRALRRTAR